MGFVYSPDNNYSVSSYISTLLSASVQLGALIGQLVLGHLADIYGRLRIFKISLLIVLIGTIGSSMSAQLDSGLTLYAVYGMWRVFTGIGFGAIYPAAALLVCEFSPTKWRGAICAAVFAMQGCAILIGPIVSIIFLSIFQSAILYDTIYLDHVWRLCIAVGIIPCLITMYLASTIPESPRHTIFVDKDLRKAENDIQFVIDRKNYKEIRIVQSIVEKKQFWLDFKIHFGIRANLKILIILSVCRFVTNIGLYGINWNINSVINACNFGNAFNNTYIINSPNATSNLYTVNLNYSVGNLLVALIGAVPGYCLAVPFIEILGRKKLQLISFFYLIVLSISLGIYSTLNKISSPEALTAILFFLQLFLDFGAYVTSLLCQLNFSPRDSGQQHVKSRLLLVKLVPSVSSFLIGFEITILHRSLTRMVHFLQ